VNELPIGLWTDKFKEFVEDLVENKELKGYKNYSTPDTVNIQITETKDGIKCNHETLKLKTQINTTNMVLFTSDNRIKKYDTPYDIIDEFCTVRYDMYVARKKFILAKLEQELKILSNKARFINDVMDEKLVLNRRDEIDIVNDLEEMKYDKNNCSEEESEAQDEDSKIKSYRYLLDMKIRSFSKQKLEELNGEIQKLEGQIRTLRNKTEKQIWMEELDEFVEQYNKWNKAPVEKSKKK
jgi:DNA topoisomerase-2